MEVLRSKPKKLKVLFDPNAWTVFDVLFWWMTVRYFPDVILLIHRKKIHKIMVVFFFLGIQWEDNNLKYNSKE